MKEKVVKRGYYEYKKDRQWLTFDLKGSRFKCPEKKLMQESVSQSAVLGKKLPVNKKVLIY